MLKEILQQHSAATNKNRRWFQGPEMGLFVWMSEEHLVERFQLIYFAYGNEQTLQWSSENGLTNFDTETDRYRSAILSSETHVDISTLREGFLAISEEIDPDVRHFIVSKLTTNSPKDKEPEAFSLP